jgi:glucose/arabinose dehydrogenase
MEVSVAQSLGIKGNNDANTLQGTDAADIIYGYDPDGGGQATTMTATRIGSGLAHALFTATPPNDPSHLFVVQQSGQIRVIDQAAGQVLPKPFLDVSGQISTADEQGLSGLAFHPNYATNGKVYVYASNQAGDVEIRQYTAPPGTLEVDPASAKLITTIDSPAGTSNHRGGWVGFGPDGYLYVAVGDGGRSANARTTANPLGKILRLDVNDFNGAGGDKLDLSRIDANATKSGGQAFSFVGAGPFTGAGQVRYELSGGDNLRPPEQRPGYGP